MSSREVNVKSIRIKIFVTVFIKLCVVRQHKPCMYVAINFRQQNLNLHKIALKVKCQGQTCPLLYELQNQLRYITMWNRIKIWQVVFTRTWLRYVRVFAVAIPSVVCLSVCRLSVVCNVGAPYSGGCSFRQNFFTAVYAGHPLTSMQNFTEIVAGEPLRRGR